MKIKETKMTLKKNIGYTKSYNRNLYTTTGESRSASLTISDSLSCSTLSCSDEFPVSIAQFSVARIVHSLLASGSASLAGKYFLTPGYGTWTPECLVARALRKTSPLTCTWSQACVLLNYHDRSRACDLRA